MGPQGPPGPKGEPGELGGRCMVGTISCLDSHFHLTGLASALKSQNTKVEIVSLEQANNKRKYNRISV